MAYFMTTFVEKKIGKMTVQPFHSFSIQKNPLHIRKMKRLSEVSKLAIL